VDWEKSVLDVFAPKTGKVRVIPMNAETRRILETWVKGKRNEFIFYHYGTGKPFVDLSAGLALARQKAGITGVTWHTLRHTFASRLLDRGVDIVTVKELLGHSTVLVTMRYLHPNLEAKVQAVAKLAANCDNP
jgi:integrase